MKRHSLVEHWNDVSTWWYEVNDLASMTDTNKQIIFFTAYERWLNDRELLTVEDEYEWKWTVVPEGGRRYGAIG